MSSQLNKLKIYINYFENIEGHNYRPCGHPWKNAIEAVKGRSKQIPEKNIEAGYYSQTKELYKKILVEGMDHISCIFHLLIYSTYLRTQGIYKLLLSCMHRMHVSCMFS